MKIAAILENPIHVGGGFNQALNAITQLARMVAGKHDMVVFTTIAGNLEYLQKLGIAAAYLGAGSPGQSPGLLTRFAGKVRRRLARFAPRAPGKMGAIERALLDNGVDIAYFVTHSSTPDSFQQLNFITTVLDLCHRDNLEFPEVSADGQFAQRELHFGTCLPRAFAVIVASEKLADNIVVRYGVDRHRLIAMPFEPSPFLADAHAAGTQEVLASYALEQGYFFYPAQFWPHKNHVRILEALAWIARNQPGVPAPRVVFSGSDHGNKKHIEKVAAQLGVSAQIRFLGFVPVDHMRALYQGSIGVVMPSYFGPTNIPPLEAWTLGKPIVYSRHLSEQVGDAAIFVDPDDAVDLARGMLQVFDDDVVSTLVAHGHQQLAVLARQQALAEEVFAASLAQFEQRRKCWN